MKILLVHNFYGSETPSGENNVVEQELALLRRRGHDVFELTRHSDQIRKQGLVGMLRGAASTPWNPWSAHAARAAVDRVRPDVVHVHNTFPLLSPAVFHAIGDRAPRVLTLHNYRLFCAAGIPMREGKICTECLDGRSAWPAVEHGCYRNSRLATLPLASSVELHRRLGTWRHEVDAFVALTEFQRARMIDAGLPAEKVHVNPNFYGGAPRAIRWSDRENVVLFAGRISAEKGVRALVEAWRSWGDAAPELRIFGDGPLRPGLEAASSSRIRWFGQRPAAEVQAQMARAKLLVVPSESFECFPLVLPEAFAHGTPVAISRIGPLPAIVRDGIEGVLFEPADPDSLCREVKRVWADPTGLERLAEAALAAFSRAYTEDRHYETMMDIYTRAGASR